MSEENTGKKLEQELKEMILGRYKSLMEFAKEAGVPYTTVVSMLKRGVSKAGISNIIKICRCLKISADELADGKIVAYENSDMKLTPEEQELIRKYRVLDERGRETVQDNLEREYNHAKKILLIESLNVTSVG